MNQIIQKMNQQGLLRTALVLLFLYGIVNFMEYNHFFINAMIIWLTIYFVTAYVKFYLQDVTRNQKINIIAFVIGFIGHYGIIVLTDLIGVFTGKFSDDILRWGFDCSPFLILMALAMVCFAKNIQFRSKTVNYISKLSFLIYIIHENALLRVFYRPLLWQYVYEHFGYNFLDLWMLVLVLIVFAFALILSILYQHTIQKITTKLTGFFYPKIAECYCSLEKKMLKQSDN
ncbi:MAG: hypothetical protein IKI29_04005 [Clostridia bacterium]|nr:hypothetical protein [Clostridia bacterium]